MTAIKPMVIVIAMNYAQGNPGAAECIIQLLSNNANLQYAISIATVLEKATSIRGTNLYVLWNDLSNKDFSIMRKLCDNCPIDILEDACSRQDYSGRELVKEYLLC